MATVTLTLTTVTLTTVTKRVRMALIRAVLVWMGTTATVAPASAQSVRGQVTDESGGALPGVSVLAQPQLGGPALTAVSAGDGRYELTVPDPSVYDVLFVLPGFSERRVQVRGGVDSTLDVVLSLLSVAEQVRVAARLEEPNTLGSRLGLTRQTTPASVDVVTRDVLRMRGADTASTSMRGVTGMTSSLRPGASAVFSTRGFIENSVGVLFDGVRVQSSTITMWNYDVFNFARVEVLRGPASVLHGEGLAAGAVNFVRRAAEGGRLRTEGLLEVGDAGRVRVGAAAAGGVGSRSAFSVSFAHNQFHTHVDEVRHEYNHVTGAFTTTMGGWTVGVDGDVLLNDVANPYWGTPLVNGAVDERLRGRSYNLSPNNAYDDTVGWGRVTASGRLGSAASYQGQVYVYRADRDWRNSYGFEFLPGTGRVLRRAVENLAYDHRLWGTRHDVRSAFTVAGRPVRVVGGIDVSRTDFSSPRSYGARVDVDAFAPEVRVFEAPDRADARRADLRQQAVFAETAVEVAPRLTVVLGGRIGTLSNDLRRPVDGVVLSQDFTPTDGRLGAVFTPSPGLSLYGQWSTGSEPIEALLILGPAEAPFSLARARMAEAGVKAEVWDGRASITGAVYHLAKRDLTTADPEDATRTVQIGRQSSRGVETSVVARPTSQWLVEANAAWLDARYDLFFEGSVSRNGNLPPNVPETVLNLGVTWQPRPLLEVGTWVSRIGERTADTTAAVRQPAYTLVDPFVRVALGGGRLADLTLRVRNLADVRYVEWATRAFGVTNVYFGEPRRVVLSLNVRY